MTITIATARFCEILTDALHTAADYGIHFDSHRAPWRDEPGDTDLLVLTSTDRYTIGHTWHPVDGSEPACVWPTASAKSALTLCKALAKKAEDHTIDIDVATAPRAEGADEDEHPGHTVTIRETPALFHADTEFQFHADPETKFPLGTCRRVLTSGLPPTTDYDETPCTLWSAHVLDPLTAVAKRRKMQIRFYRSPKHRVQLVQIGDTWLGAAMPAPEWQEDPGDSPDVEPHIAIGGTDAEDLMTGEMTDAERQVRDEAEAAQNQPPLYNDDGEPYDPQTDPEIDRPGFSDAGGAE